MAHASVETLDLPLVSSDEVALLTNPLVAAPEHPVILDPEKVPQDVDFRDGGVLVIEGEEGARVYQTLKRVVRSLDLTKEVGQVEAERLNRLVMRGACIAIDAMAAA